MPFLGLHDLGHLPDLCFGHSREGLGDVFEVREGGFEGGFEGGLFAHRRTDDLAIDEDEGEGEGEGEEGVLAYIIHPKPGLTAT